MSVNSDTLIPKAFAIFASVNVVGLLFARSE